MGFSIPGAAEISKAREEIDHVIDAATKVLDFATKYGHFIPGVSAEVAALAKIDAALKSAKALIDHV